MDLKSLRACRLPTETFPPIRTSIVGELSSLATCCFFVASTAPVDLDLGLSCTVVFTQELGLQLGHYMLDDPSAGFPPPALCHWEDSQERVASKVCARAPNI